MSLFLHLAFCALAFNLLPLPAAAIDPSIGGDFPDPSIIYAENSWWAFGTTSRGVHIPIAQSNDFNSWTVRDGADMLPNLPGWVNSGQPDVWAPNVVQVADNRYVMYFSAAVNWNANIHCLGTAVSSTVSGPYQASEDIFACDQDRGGSIDPSGFQDPATGKRYIVYKVDGNALGEGGPCRNEQTKYSTPLMLQEVDQDGVTKIGGPTQVLDRDEIDGPLIEAPSLTMIGGQYYLFFSSNCYSTEWYDISFAVANNVYGPYTKRGPMLLTNDLGLWAPGGAGLSSDGNFIAFHAGPVGQRSMYTGQIAFNGGTEITLCSNGGCMTAN